MSLSASLIETPLYDKNHHLSYAWIKFLAQVGQATPALVFLNQVQFLKDDPNLRANGTLVFETDSGTLYRVQYSTGQNPRADYIQFDFVIGDNLVTLGAIPVVESPGVLAESSITDDGTTVSTTEDIETAGVYKVAGTQVVTSQQADPGTAMTAPTLTATTITFTAGATYTSNEQSMLAQLKTAVNQLNTDISNMSTTFNDIITDRNRLRTILQTHGLMA